MPQFPPLYKVQIIESPSWLLGGLNELVRVKYSELCQAPSKHLASVGYYCPEKETKKYSAHMYDVFCHYFSLSLLGNKKFRQFITIHITHVKPNLFLSMFGQRYWYSRIFFSLILCTNPDWCFYKPIDFRIVKPKAVSKILCFLP